VGHARRQHSRSVSGESATPADGCIMSLKNSEWLCNTPENSLKLRLRGNAPTVKPSNANARGQQTNCCKRRKLCKSEQQVTSKLSGCQGFRNQGAVYSQEHLKRRIEVRRRSERIGKSRSMPFETNCIDQTTLSMLTRRGEKVLSFGQEVTKRGLDEAGENAPFR
jgi:hypothetical protein